MDKLIENILMSFEILLQGIETIEQVEKMIEFGCDLQSGFFYFAIVNGEQLMKMLGKPLVIEH